MGSVLHWDCWQRTSYWELHWMFFVQVLPIYKDPPVLLIHYETDSDDFICLSPGLSFIWLWE